MLAQIAHHLHPSLMSPPGVWPQSASFPGGYDYHRFGYSPSPCEDTPDFSVQQPSSMIPYAIAAYVERMAMQSIARVSDF